MAKERFFLHIPFSWIKTSGPLRNQLPGWVKSNERRKKKREERMKLLLAMAGKWTRKLYEFKIKDFTH